MTLKSPVARQELAYLALGEIWDKSRIVQGVLHLADDVLHCGPTSPRRKAGTARERLGRLVAALLHRR